MKLEINSFYFNKSQNFAYFEEISKIQTIKSLP